MGSHMKAIENEILSWPSVSVRPHQFVAREFRFNRAEIGHLHLWGMLDIPFPRAVRDVLVEAGLAEEHHRVPDSGWTSFRIGGAGDAEHVLWLMRLSWLRYAMKTAADPAGLLKDETERLRLNPRMASLLGRFAPAGKQGSVLLVRCW
ncbi:MAG: luciferase family protein [Terracidiphilus sp.]